VVKIASVDPAQLNFTYRIEGPNLPFRPIRAFDDGSHVYIQMPPGMKTSDAPALLIAAGKELGALQNDPTRMNRSHRVDWDREDARFLDVNDKLALVRRDRPNRAEFFFGLAASRMKSASSAAFKLSGISSRLANGRSAAELPISRLSSGAVPRSSGGGRRR
jgi:hypothetical protein